MRRSLLAAVVMAAIVAAIVIVPQQKASATPDQQTVPAMHQWTPASGQFTFTTASRVVVDPAYAAQLSGDAGTFAGDLADLLGRTVTVAQSTTPATGDVFLTLGGTDPAEGYTLTAAASIRIQASTSAGAFYGTRSVLQLLKQSPTIPAGTSRDWPAKRERGLMVDQGRKYFSVDWLRRHIKELAYLKLNTFHFHLSDTFGFRLESSTHPEVVSPQHYSKQEMRDLIALAARYHVQIIPEIDMPGT